MVRKSFALRNDSEQTNASWSPSLAFWRTLGLLEKPKKAGDLQYNQRGGLVNRMAMAFYEISYGGISLPSRRAFFMANSIILSLALSSCFANVTTTKISHKPDGTIT